MSKYFPYEVKAPKSIPEIADGVLDEFFAVVDKLNIRACLAYGSCLGFVRDGGYIDGDNDHDVVVILQTDELRTKLSESLTEHGFVIGQKYPPPLNNTHFVKNGVLLDIYFRADGEYYKKFGYVEYKGKKYPVPHPVEEYLSKCYTNWKVPSDEMGHYFG